ncbi:MAG: CBS domain-containing protein [Planctomycetes bacterium]|nr:CBS domain-containing protein [Planctomycetota bacterium]
MKVHELCRRAPYTIGPDANLAQAVAAMWEGDCGALVVVDAETRPLAVITDRDIAVALGTRDVAASALKVSDVMSRRLFTCLSDDDVRASIRFMVRNGVRRLPVIDREAKLTGMLSVNDLVLAAQSARMSRHDELTWADLVPALEVLYRPSRSRIPDHLRGEAKELVTT